VGVAIITINFLAWFANHGIYFRITGEYNTTLNDWTYTVMPGIFLFVDCIFLLVALVWICYSLKNDPEVMGNEKWMGLHSVLLVLMLGSYLWVRYFIGDGYTIWKIYEVINCVINFLMAYIMD
jgi:CDP-diglyceride synthetase